MLNFIFGNEWSLKITANEQGLLLCWYLCSSSPELKPNRITKDEDNN
jgi:hypothetical protein